MKETGTVTTEIEMKAMSYINTGYQRILTFECKDGGFNWWEGDNPGNAILSALAIQMLTDTKKIYDTVDEKVIKRTADHLFSVQKGDGSWSEEAHLHAGNENLGAGSLRATCYIAWSLAAGGFSKDAGMTKALTYIKSQLPSEKGAYTLAMCSNALLEAGDTSTLVSDILTKFHDSAVVEDDKVHWTATGDTIVNSGGSGADVELTSLVALAMAAKGAYPADVTGAVAWLISTKDPQGNWGYNTQATVLALKTFLKALYLNAGDTDAEVKVRFNGSQVASKKFDNFNKDVLWQVELLEGIDPSKNLVEMEYSGTGSLSYQIVAVHYIPWDEAELAGGELTIDVSYDASTVKVDDLITATVTITNNNPQAQGMVLVTVGLPPGFTLVTQDLAMQKDSGKLNNFEVTGKQLILYFNSIPAGEPTQVTYSLVAQYPIKAQTGGAEAKYYYNSEVKAEQDSQEVEVID